jgi:hypothetical protein
MLGRKLAMMTIFMIANIFRARHFAPLLRHPYVYSIPASPAAGRRRGLPKKQVISALKV